MEPILAHFDLPIDQMTEVARRTHSIIAGSAPLCALVDWLWKPNDLDIWFYDDRIEMVNKAYTEFLTLCGYVPDTSPAADKYNEPAYLGRTIARFYRASDPLCMGQSIQIIQTHIPVHDVINDFDLSCCMTWWDPDTNELKTHDAEATLAGVMYSLHEPVTDREKRRIRKYLCRGFVFK